MADNFIANPGAGGDTFGADDVAGVKYPRSKVGFGADGVYSDVSPANPLPVELADGTNFATLKALSSGVVDADIGLVSQSVIHGRSTAGGGSFVDVKVNPSGALVVDAGGSQLPLPTGAATETTLALINGKTPALGQATMANSQPVVIASNQGNLPIVENSLILTGAAAQTAIVNNILENPSGTTATDVSNYRAMSVQVVSTGTGGTFIFEQSNDNINFVALPVFNSALVTGVPITAAITATASQIIYTIPLRCRFIRLRIVTTITGGSIQAFSRVSTEPWTSAAQLVASNTAANLLATVSGTVTANIGTGALAAGTNLIGDVGVQLRATTPGTTLANVLSTATNNLTQLKASAGKIVGGFLSNTTATLQYVKLFALPSASVTMGTTNATTQIAIQPNQTINLTQSDFGTFLGGTGVTYAITTAPALNDNTATTANSVIGYILWI